MAVSHSPFKFADLFCGIGSFHVALTRCGGVCAMACDINSKVRTVYERAYGVEPLSDIASLPADVLATVDVVSAGFPCQPFSRAGLGKGFEDAGRGNMFEEICRLIRGSFSRETLPLLILENVQGLMTHERGETFATILRMLSELGYSSITHAVLKCSDFGIPQNRKRLFVVASRTENEWTKTVASFRKEPKSLSDFLGVRLEKNIANTIRCGGAGSPVDDRHNWDSYYTVDENGERCGVYRLSLADALKLQGFDPSFFEGSKISATAAMKMVGNSIPVVMSEAVCRATLSN